MYIGKYVDYNRRSIVCNMIIRIWIIDNLLCSDIAIRIKVQSPINFSGLIGSYKTLGI